MKSRTGDEVSREPKPLTLATQWRRAGPLHPNFPRNTKAQAKLGVGRKIVGPAETRPETRKPSTWLGCWREALQNRFPISNSSFNIAHFRGKWTPFSWFITRLF